MKSLKKVLGVTLLEIMLVLAIAAMIIVMSVRYYQSATSSSQANAALSQIQAIMSAADGLAQATGSYMTPALNNAAIAPLLPANGLIMPWGAGATVAGTAAGTYTITLTDVPRGVCPLLTTKLLSNNHVTTTGTCAAAAVTPSLIFTYTAAV